MPPDTEAPPPRRGRNKVFASPGRAAPFDGREDLHLAEETVDGALHWFNPTVARFRVDQPSQRPRKDVGAVDGESPGGAGESDAAAVTSADTGLAPGTEVMWRSRDNRKGRHCLVVEDTTKGAAAHPTATFKAVLAGIGRMFTQFPYWDVSWLVSVFFAVGCAIFIASGFFYWLPLAAPGSTFAGESLAGAITSFVGATLFQVGAVLLVLEAFNEEQTGCFGWALHQVVTGDEGDDEGGDGGEARGATRAEKGHCKHHHRLGPGRGGQRWRWWPSWEELRTHYIHEIGFVASISLAIGATIFYVSGICTLPGIYSNMSLGLRQGLYWLTYLVGGVIFIFASVLYVLETQPNWYMPAPQLLGWHIGVWNLIGSVGWTLSASMGYCTRSGCEYQGELALTWASIAYLIGSLLQWYESLHKYPVEKMKKRKA